MNIFKKTSQCRACGHERKTHFMYIPVNDGTNEFTDLMYPLESIPCNIHTIGLGNSIICGCSEWSPLDNLEYLELKHRKNEESK